MEQGLFDHADPDVPGSDPALGKQLASFPVPNVYAPQMPTFATTHLAPHKAQMDKRLMQLPLLSVQFWSICHGHI